MPRKGNRQCYRQKKRRCCTNDNGDEENQEVSKQNKHAGQKEEELNVGGEMCVVENKEDSEDHEDEQKQGEQQQKQQCEQVMQQQEEEKDIIDEIYDLEDKENTESGKKNIVIEMNDELEETGVSKCESIYRTRKWRSKMKMIKTLISCGNFNDQCDVLESFLMDSQLEEHRSKLNIFNQKDSLKIESFDNIAKIMSYSSPQKKGNLEVNKKMFQDCIVASIIDTPSSENDKSIMYTSSKVKTSLKNDMLSESFSISKRTLQRKVKKGYTSRNAIFQNSSSKSWFKVPSRKKYSKITPQIKSKLNEWILNHEHVKKSSRTKDTIKVSLDGCSEKVVLPKYFLQIPISELHSDLFKSKEEGSLAESRDENGKVIISDSSLRQLLPRNVYPMSNQRRDLCGCETCVSADMLQCSLNLWRIKHLKRLESLKMSRTRYRSSQKYIERYDRYKNEAFPAGLPLHAKSSHAAFSTMCSFPVESIHIPHFDCVLKCCTKCPNLQIPAEECSTDDQIPYIKYHIYKNVYRCTLCGQLPFEDGNKRMLCGEATNDTKVGNIYKRTELVLCNTSITKFHEEFYKPTIEKLAYHLAHVKILGTYHIGLTRREALLRRQDKKDIKTRRDFADRLVAAFAAEIQSEHFGGNQSLSMEGIAMEYVETSTELNGLNNVKGEFHSFLSDDSDQDAATTAAHTEKFISLLLESNRVMSNKSTIMEDTDGCAKQYRSANSLYLMSAISKKYGIVIDRAVGAPGHGKDIVDGLNAVDKRYLKTAMFRTVNPEKNGSKKTMNSHSATATGSFCFAEECKSMLQHHADHVSNVLTSKSSKRQSERKFSKKTYHIQKKQDVPHRNIAMTWTKSKFPKLKFANNKQKIRGSSSVLSHYHYRFDPRLGHGKCAMRRIPCLCEQCCEMLDKKWIPRVQAENQPCYSPVTNCKYHKILGDYNNWIIMSFT